MSFAGVFDAIAARNVYLAAQAKGLGQVLA